MRGERGAARTADAGVPSALEDNERRAAARSSSTSGNTLSASIPIVEVTEEGEENGLASMLAELLRQNLAARTVARRRCAAMRGSVVLHARDADVTITLEFRGHEVRVHDGPVADPDATIRADADAIVTMSRLPIRTAFELPIFDPRDARDREALAAWREALRTGQIDTAVHRLRAVPLLLRLTSILSVGT